MREYKIILRTDEVKEFVKKACKCDFDVDIAYNRYEVDAKSILGVLGLNFSEPLTVTCHGYNEEFDRYLKQFALAS